MFAALNSCRLHGHPGTLRKTRFASRNQAARPRPILQAQGVLETAIIHGVFHFLGNLETQRPLMARLRPKADDTTSG